MAELWLPIASDLKQVGVEKSSVMTWGSIAWMLETESMATMPMETLASEDESNSIQRRPLLSLEIFTARLPMRESTTILLRFPGPLQLVNLFLMQLQALLSNLTSIIPTKVVATD